MKLNVFALVVAVALFSVPMVATTVDFNAYGASTGLSYGQAEWLGVNSLAFSGFTLSTSNWSLQLDAPGYYGATNYELLSEGDLTITFNSPQSAVSIDLRDFSGYGGMDTIYVYGADGVTLLSSTSQFLSASVVTFNDNFESVPIGVVSLSNIDYEGWTGILQSVTYNGAAIPEPATSALFGTGVLALAAMLLRRTR